MFDCNQCLNKCHGACCGVIPFADNFIKKHKPVRKIVEEFKLDRETALVGEGGVCPYLGEDFKCTVYNDRPEVCRLYGHEERLKCPWQDKNGRLRSRQERRAIERENEKLVDRFFKRHV
jgi:Fe-S-cluster containining protein